MLDPNLLAWSVPAPFAEAQVPEVSVVYRIRAWDADGRTPRPIARVHGTDASGTLDIGESGNGRKRLQAFWARANGKSGSHAAARDYDIDHYDLKSVFPPSTLRIEFIQLETKNLAEAVELALLEHYRWTFKDRPPLNGSAGKYNKVSSWLGGRGRKPRTADGWLDLDGLLPPHALVHR